MVPPLPAILTCTPGMPRPLASTTVPEIWLWARANAVIWKVPVWPVLLDQWPGGVVKPIEQSLASVPLASAV